ncbi:MAG: hypothetical protein ACRDK9_04790 [Solirubrobacterales bacterium]
MKRAIDFVVRIGDGVDALGGALRALPGQLGAALGVRRFRRIAALVALAYLLLYLLAIQDIAISASGKYGRFADTPSVEVVSEWPERILAERAPFLFEPIATAYPIPQLALFLSPGNLLVGSTLAALLGLTVAAALWAGSRQRACGRMRFAGVLGALPGLLLGFSCCAPTLILLLGPSFAAAFLPAFIPLRPYLFPFAVGLMAAMLVWSARRTLTAGEALASGRSPRRSADGREDDLRFGVVLDRRLTVPAPKEDRR